MAKIPEHLRGKFIIPGLVDKLISQGKVRDIYQGRDESELLLVSTDRASIFDFNLDGTVPGKGFELTRITHHMLTHVLGVPNHLIPSKTDPSKNGASDLNGMGVPVERSLLVKKAKVLPFELIFRHHLGGSVYKKYLETGLVAGVKLKPGIPKWGMLDEPLFTPSTKAPDGHDINITQDEYFAATGEAGRWGFELMLLAYQRAYAYARSRGFLILDTKGEAGMTIDNKMVLVDELFTPDSSRWVKEEEWKRAMELKRDPEFYDKEKIREWGRTVETPFQDGKTGQFIIGINNLDPQNDEHVAFVHKLTVPEEVLLSVASRCHEIGEAMLAI